MPDAKAMIITAADLDGDGWYPQSDLRVDGDLRIEAPTFRLRGSMYVTGDLTVAGNQDVRGDQTVVGNQDVRGDQTVVGNQYVGGYQSVGGDQYVRCDQSVGGYQYVGGNQSVVGNQSVGGNQSVVGYQEVCGYQHVGELHFVRTAHFTGLYPYHIMIGITPKGVRYVHMGCLHYSLEEWDRIGIRKSNLKEFPDDGSDKCEERVAAFEFAMAAALRMKLPDPPQEGQ